MKAAEWIDRVKTAKGWPSDYRVAKELGIATTTVSMYRSRNSTLDEDTAVKVAEALGERPEAVYLDQLAERTKSPTLRAALTSSARQLCILCKVDKAPDLIAGFRQMVSAALITC
jgi:hypothetical protein